MVNYLNVCLKLPNVGLVSFYLTFVVLLPMIIVTFTSQFGFLKYYLPILIAFANTLTLAGTPYIFQNLYVLNPKNFISWVSKNTINLIAVIGIFWQVLEYSQFETIKSTMPIYSIIYGLILIIITFVVSTSGLKLFLDQIDKWSDRKNKRTYKNQQNDNWYKLAFGLIFIILIIGAEVLFISLLNSLNPNMNLSNSGTNFLNSTPRMNSPRANRTN